MGNQGHAKERIRLAREWYEAGAIGKVKEVHVWTTNKTTVGKYKSALKNWPTDNPPVPGGLDWILEVLNVGGVYLFDCSNNMAIDRCFF